MKHTKTILHLLKQIKNIYAIIKKERIALNHQRWREENIEQQRSYFQARHQTQKSNPVYIAQRKKDKQAYKQTDNAQQANKEYTRRPDVKEHRHDVYLLMKETETEEEKQHKQQIIKKMEITNRCVLWKRNAEAFIKQSCKNTKTY